MAFIRLFKFAPQARALTRSFATTSRAAGPRTLATPFASPVTHKPSSQELSEHYNKFLDVYENDELLVSSHNLTQRTVTHNPVEEILEAPVNMKAETVTPSSANDASASETVDSYSPTNNVYFVDGRESKLSFA